MDYKMTPDEWKTFYKDQKKFKALAQNRYYCYCGHSVVINPREKRVMCRHCGHWVYKDKQEYFKERMKGILKDENIAR